MEQKTNSPDRSYLDYPFVGVGVVVWRDDQFLLIQRGKPPRKGQWSIPGGRQELGETVKETAVREVLEETNLIVQVTDFLDVVDSIQKDNTGQISFHATLIDYGAEWISGEAKAGDDAMGVAWHNMAELETLPLWSETKRIIQLSYDFREKRRNA